MNVYFISGLGADRRAFERLHLSEKYAVHYLDWIPPIKDESLNDYAKRMASFIDRSQPYAIVGLSMGGMIASAMTQFLQPHKTILLSSIACNAEFPPLLRFARRTKAYKILPKAVFRSKNLWLIQRMFGTKAPAEKTLLAYFISNTDPSFVKWAIGAIITWQDCERPKSVFQVHGNSDKMFPVKYTKPDVVVNKGSHFMVFTKAAEVSRILEQALA